MNLTTGNRYIYIPALDYIIQDIYDRCTNKTLELFNFPVLYPGNYKNDDSETLKQLVEKYKSFLLDSADLILIELKSELECWNTHWKVKNTDTFFSGLLIS